MDVKCCVTDCNYNHEGECTKDSIYISDSESGSPECQDSKFNEE